MRFYDPALGRFLARDMLSKAVALGRIAPEQLRAMGVPWPVNPYIYANNDPLSSLDPRGLFVLRLPNRKGTSGIFPGPTCPTTYTLLVDGVQKCKRTLKSKHDILQFDYNWLKIGPEKVATGEIVLIVDRGGAITREKIGYMRTRKPLAPQEKLKFSNVPFRRSHAGNAQFVGEYLEYQFVPQGTSRAEGKVGLWLGAVTIHARFSTLFEPPNLDRLRGSSLKVVSVSEAYERDVAPAEVKRAEKTEKQTTIGPGSPNPYWSQPSDPIYLYTGTVSYSHKMRARWFATELASGQDFTRGILKVKFSFEDWPESAAFTLPGATRAEIGIEKQERAYRRHGYVPR